MLKLNLHIMIAIKVASMYLFIFFIRAPDCCYLYLEMRWLISFYYLLHASNFLPKRAIVESNQ